MVGQALGYGDDLRAGLTLAENDFWVTGAQGAMVVDMRKTEVFKRQSRRRSRAVSGATVPLATCCSSWRSVSGSISEYFVSGAE